MVNKPVLELLGDRTGDFPPLQLWTPYNTRRRSLGALGASVSSPTAFFLVWPLNRNVHDGVVSLKKKNQSQRTDEKQRFPKSQKMNKNRGKQLSLYMHLLTISFQTAATSSRSARRTRSAYYSLNDNTPTENHAGRIACCPLVSHVECAPRALLRLEKDGTDGRTDARPLFFCTLLLSTDAVSVIIRSCQEVSELKPGCLQRRQWNTWIITCQNSDVYTARSCVDLRWWVAVGRRIEISLGFWARQESLSVTDVCSTKPFILSYSVLVFIFPLIFQFLSRALD